MGRFCPPSPVSRCWILANLSTSPCRALRSSSVELTPGWFKSWTSSCKAPSKRCKIGYRTNNITVQPLHAALQNRWRCCFSLYMQRCRTDRGAASACTCSVQIIPPKASNLVSNACKAMRLVEPVARRVLASRSTWSTPPVSCTARAMSTLPLSTSTKSPYNHFDWRWRDPRQPTDSRLYSPSPVQPAATSASAQHPASSAQPNLPPAKELDVERISLNDSA